MERLIHSKAIPWKPHCNLKPSSNSLVPRFVGVVSARKMAFSSASFRWVPLPEQLRVKSISCRLEDPSLVSPEIREELSFSVDLIDGLAPKPRLRRLILWYILRSGRYKWFGNCIDILVFVNLWIFWLSSFDRFWLLLCDLYFMS